MHTCLAEEDYSTQSLSMQAGKNKPGYALKRVTLLPATMTNPLMMAAGYFGALMILSAIMINPLTEWLAAFKKSLHYQHQTLIL